MFVLHTTIFEVYSRLWTVHEVDEATHENIPIQGLFDVYRWSVSQFHDALAIQTEKSECRQEDRGMLEDQIMRRGGFEVLDSAIANFRKEMLEQLKEALQPKQDHKSGMNGCMIMETTGDNKHDWVFQSEDS